MSNFGKVNNLRPGTKECNCGTCEFGSTDGMLAPAYWCARASIDNSRVPVGYCYTEDKWPGTVCDLYKKEEVQEVERDWTDENYRMLRDLAKKNHIPFEQAKKILESQGYDLSKEMYAQAKSMGRV